MSLRYGTVVSMEGERQVYRKTTDYIRHSTFPGGMLLCDSAIAKGAAEAGLKVESSFAFGADYARTCRMWAESLAGRRDRLARLGYGGATMRHGQYYLEALRGLLRRVAHRRCAGRPVACLTRSPSIPLTPGKAACS